MPLFEGVRKLTGVLRFSYPTTVFARVDVETSGLSRLNEDQIAERGDRMARRGDRDGRHHSLFNSVGLHWLLGLILLARGDESGALEQFDQQLEAEHFNSLYARECSANTWYAVGALKLRQGRWIEAQTALRRALDQLPTHALARVGLIVAGGTADETPPATTGSSFDATMSHAAELASAGDHDGAARIVASALHTAPEGSAGWLLPVEPLLRVSSHPEAWAGPLARLRRRAV